MPTQVNCPQCQTRFVVQVRSIIDIGQEPDLKEEFLAGQVNYAECPKCGAGGQLGTPLVYHDPEKELLISYVPAEIGLPADEQEKLVGSLVNAVMNSVPQEQRKGYFLRPRSALTFEGLYDAILEADGYSPEMLEEQRQRLRLVTQLATNIDDAKTLDSLVEEHRARLDYEFFMLLSQVIERHREEGDTERADLLTRVREELLNRVNLSAPSAAPTMSASVEELIQALLAASDDATWRRTVVANRARLDYAFFQGLTGQIEAAKQGGHTERAEQLGKLRQRLLDELDAQQRMAREAQDVANLLIMQLSEAGDIEAAVRENLEQVNEVFLAVLMRLVEVANEHKQEKRAARLNQILEATLNVLEERLPPMQRLLNRLARSAYPDGTSKVLEQNRRILSQELVQEIDAYIADAQQAGDETLVEHLTEVRGQVVAKLTILRA
jgi:hypothetical protein